ncbi:MAG: hypothetical protein ACOC8L_07250 [Spirochaetota bacterium]
MDAKRRIALPILLFTYSIAALAQQLDLTGLRIAVAGGAASTELEAEKQAVRSSVIVWLDRRGATPIEIEDNVALFDDPAAESLARARDGDSDLLILADVKANEGRLTTLLELYEVESGTLVAVAESEEVVGVMFDRAVARLTETLIRSAEATVASLLRSQGTTSLPADTTDAEANEANEQLPPETAPAPSGPVQVADSDARSPLLAFRVGFSPQAPVYDSADYLGFSWGASLHGAYFPERNGLWAVGLAGRVILSQASGAAASANVLTAPFGITAELSPRIEPFAPVVRLTAGAAYMRVTNEQLGSFTSIVPYGALDLGTLIPLTELIALEFGLGIEVLIEQSIALIGLYPTLSVTFDL